MAVQSAMDQPSQKAEKAQAKLADSAVQLKDSAQLQLESAERRTVLAADRTVYAAERTYAAWIRTGLAALASGVGARSLLADMAPEWVAIATGGLLILFSAFCFLAAIWRELLPSTIRPVPDAPRLPTWILMAFTGCLLLIAAGILFGLMRVR